MAESSIAAEEIASSRQRESSAELYKRLLRWFSGMDKVLVAYSGGVDSCLVLKAAVDALGAERVAAVTGDSPSLARSELKKAEDLASSLGVEHVILRTRELENPSYQANLGNRCYFCKSTLYETLMERFRARFPGQVLVDGTNFDDLSDHRPGAAAAKEAGVRHPLVELQVGKDAVRALSKHAGLPTWDKPAMACLSSRVPAGVSVTEEKLRMIEEAEEQVRALGFTNVRVRYHELKSLKDASGESPLTLARLELGPDEIVRGAELRLEIGRALRNAGFSLATIDLEGYRLGGGVSGGK